MNENTLKGLLADTARFKKKSSKEYSFMGIPVSLTKLTILQVEELQEVNKDKSEDAVKVSDLEVMFMIIRSGCPEFEDLSSEEVKAFPMDELVKLSTAISVFSGLSDGKK